MDGIGRTDRMMESASDRGEPDEGIRGKKLRVDVLN